jgi:hypothetical protein
MSAFQLDSAASEAYLADQLGFLASRGKAPKRRTPQFRDLRDAVSLAFKIDSWKPYYSLRMVPHGGSDRCEEDAGYDLSATCLAPPRFAGQTVPFRLRGSDTKLEAVYESGAPLGLLCMRKGTSEYIGSIPTSELHRAAEHIASGLYGYIIVISDAPSRGLADVHVIRFECDLDPEEFPEAAIGRAEIKHDT